MNDPGGPPEAPDGGEAPRAAAPKVDGRAPALPGAPSTAPRRPPSRPAAPAAAAAPPAGPPPVAVPATAAPTAAGPPAAVPATASEPTPAPPTAAASTAVAERPAEPEVEERPDAAVAPTPDETVADDQPSPASASGASPARPRPSTPAIDPPPAIGRSLRRDPLPEQVVTRRRTGRLPTPPSPPFVEDEDPYRWKVQLPSSLFRKVTVRVGDGVLDVGGTEVALDDVAEVRFKLEVEAALVRRAASARMTATMVLADGTSVRVTARNAASSRRATAIVETLGYLWTILGDTAGADQRKAMIEKLDRGQEVQVGRLRMTSIGVAWKRHPIARWSTLGDPTREGLDVVIPVDGADPIVVPLTDDDAYMLPSLVPILRRRFA